MYLFFVEHMHHTSSYFSVLVSFQEEETDSQKAKLTTFADFLLCCVVPCESELADFDPACLFL